MGDGGWYTSRGRSGLLVLALIALLLALLVLINLGALQPGRAAPSGEFVVRIAPFVVAGDARTGAIVADQLRTELARRLTTGANVAVLRDPVATPEAALEAARTNGAEMMIWGTADPGATANAPALRPRLTWVPDEPFEPRRWQGFDAHLALPRYWELAAAPLNGTAVLPPLLDSLALFSRGDADYAMQKLDTLQRDYGEVLRPELPATLRAMIFWAEGLLQDSEAETRKALQTAPGAELWNNLGALLLDQQHNDGARDALLKALALDPNLVAAHANLGRLFMNESRPAEALPDLWTAAQLDARPVVLAGLGEAYRRAGQLRNAREVVDAVLRLEPNNAPALSERAMLALTAVETTTAALEWELEEPPQRSLQQLADVRAQSERGLKLIEQLRAGYLSRANAYGAAGRPAMQRLMETQARRLEEELLNRRYQQALVLIEQGRVQQQQPRSSLARFWDVLRGRRTPLQEAVILVESALKQAPGGNLQYELQYQRGRAAFLNGDSRLAQQAWDTADSLTSAPGSPLKPRPEARYGRARLLLKDGKPKEAQAELERALGADERYFPAHQALAKLAQDEGRWADAEPHLRWLMQNRPSPQATLALATALQKEQRRPEAEALLLPLANQNDAPSLALLGRLYREAGQFDAAAAALDRALATAPNSAEAYEERGLVALAGPKPDYAAAENLLRRSIQIAPGRPSAHLELGKLLATGLGRPGAAAEQFKAAVQLNANDPLAYRELGEALLASGAPEAAADSFNRALKLQPDSHEAHHGLATAYLALKRLDAAAGEEQKALDLAKGNYTLAIVGLGDIARERGRYDEAIARYTDALQRDPALAGAFLGLGRTAAAQGRWEIARGQYQRGLEANPNNVLLLLALGQVQLTGGDTQAALQSFERARQLAPDNTAATAGVGQALWKSGRLEEALMQFDAAVRRNPADAESLLAMGELYASQGKQDQALDAYNRAAKARKDWYEPYYRRGVLLLEQQQTAPAIKELQTAVRMNDAFPQGHYWLGRGYRAIQRYPDAIKQFRRAVALQPNYYEARYFLGRTLDEQGNGAEAVTTYKSLIADAPTGDQWRVEAERELARINPPAPE